MGEVAVLLHHGGDGHTALCPKAVVTEVQVCHTGVGLWWRGGAAGVHMSMLMVGLTMADIACEEDITKAVK